MLVCLSDFHTWFDKAIKESLERFRRFCNYYWGAKKVDFQTEVGKGDSTLDLTPADLPNLNIRSIKTLLIRNEYKLAYKAIVKRITEQTRSVFLFTGQAGTGST